MKLEHWVLTLTWWACVALHNGCNQVYVRAPLKHPDIEFVPKWGLKYEINVSFAINSLKVFCFSTFNIRHAVHRSIRCGLTNLLVLTETQQRKPEQWLIYYKKLQWQCAEKQQILHIGKQFRGSRTCNVFLVISGSFLICSIFPYSLQCTCTQLFIQIFIRYSSLLHSVD